MSLGVNNCTFLGTLGRDPEVRYLNDGTATANLSLAVNRVWKNKQGEKESSCEWIRLVMFGHQAEFAGQYAQKGSQVFAEGRLQTRKWTDKQGIERYTAEIMVKNFQLLGGKPKAEQAPSAHVQPIKTQPEQMREAYAGANHYREEDCPF